MNDLPKLVVNANWKLPASRLPHWLVHNAGYEIENISSKLIELVKDEMGSGTITYLAGEMRNEAGIDRPLRFFHTLQPGHISTTDVILRAEGSDLYVRVLSKPKTFLAYLRFLWMSGIFVICVASLLFVYFGITDAKRNWAQDYAQTLSKVRYPGENKEEFVRRCILEGYYRTDWEGVRFRLREQPVILRRMERLLSDANVNDAMTRFSYINEYYPEFLAEQLLTNSARWLYRGENVDSYGMFRKTGELRRGYDFDPTYPLWYTETLKEVNPVPEICSMFEDEDLDSILNSCTIWHPPHSYFGLFLGDPRGCLMNVLAPCGIIGTVVGFFVWRLPRSWLRYPCKILGWISPDDFESQSIARNGRVVRLLSSVLLDFGFDRTAITELGDIETNHV